MIETDRLLIRPYEIQDAGNFILEIQNNKAHLADFFFSMLKATENIQGVNQYLSQKQEDWESKKGYACGIFLKDTQKLIGHISIREIDWRIPKGELGYFIYKSYTGQKFSQEALKAFSDWCINKQKFNRIFMKIAPDNIPSIKTAEGCSFKFEGLLRKDYRRREGNLIDMNIYSFISADK